MWRQDSSAQEPAIGSKKKHIKLNFRGRPLWKRNEDTAGTPALLLARELRQRRVVGAAALEKGLGLRGGGIPGEGGRQGGGGVNIDGRSPTRNNASGSVWLCAAGQCLGKPNTWRRAASRR